MPMGDNRRTTFRISKIPAGIGKTELEGILSSKLSQISPSGQGVIPARILNFSLAPSPVESGRYKVATVTFESVPLQLNTCGGSGNWVSLEFDINSAPAKLEFDSHFIGLTPLDDSSGSYQVDIVFVTGLGGHAFGSWKAKGQHTMWLRDFLPKDIEDKYKTGTVRILTYGYDTRLLATTSNAGIAEFGRGLLETVKSARGTPRERRRPIIFVGHSLGGLVVKKALLQASTGSKTDQDVSISVYACIFLGVPHRGMENKQLKRMVKGQPNESLISDLSAGSSFLEELEKNFHQRFPLDYLRVFSIYETCLTATVEKGADGVWRRTGPPVEMVSKESALGWSLGGPRHTQIPRNVDHSTLAKFSSIVDNDYEILRGHILNCIEEAPEIIRERHRQEEIVSPDNNKRRHAMLNDSIKSRRNSEGEASRADCCMHADCIAAKPHTRSLLVDSLRLLKLAVSITSSILASAERKRDHFANPIRDIWGGPYPALILFRNVYILTAILKLYPHAHSDTGLGFSNTTTMYQHLEPQQNKETRDFNDFHNQYETLSWISYDEFDVPMLAKTGELKTSGIHFLRWEYDHAKGTFHAFIGQPWSSLSLHIQYYSPVRCQLVHGLLYGGFDG